MALLWADSFDHYGTGATGQDNMELAGYTCGTANIAPSVDHQYSGPNYCVVFEDAAGDKLSRLIDSTSMTSGVAFRLYLPSYPSGANNCFVQLQTAALAAILTVCFTSTGAIAVRSGDNTGTVLGTSAAAVFSAATFDHVEIKAVVDASTGSVEVRVNGSSVLSLTGLNLGSTSPGKILFSSTASYDVSSGGIDNLVIWDGAGSANNDFFGLVNVYTYYPTSDTVEADWTPNSGSTGYTQIDDTVPDGDATYIQASVVTDKSEFGFSGFDDILNIRGVQMAVNASLSTGATGNMQISLVSSAAASSGPDQALTTTYTYYNTIHETDPNTSAAWTKSTLEAALLRAEKTA